MKYSTINCKVQFFSKTKIDKTSPINQTNPNFNTPSNNNTSIYFGKKKESLFRVALT